MRRALVLLPWVLPAAALGALVGCAAPRTPPATATDLVDEAPSRATAASSPPATGTDVVHESPPPLAELAGVWVAQTPPPLIQTQLTPGCHTLLRNIAASSPRLTFSDREVSFRADSLGGVAMTLERRFPWSRSPSAPDRAAIDHTAYVRPAHLLIPCGAMPAELRIAASGERLTSNVAHCEPCAHEAAIDGLVGVTWLREAAH